MDLKGKIKELAADSLQEVTAVRRHLHAHPELSYEEVETSAYVCARLDEMGIPYKAGWVKTGIVAHIEGKNPESKTIALRADLDALPIKEENEVEYKSTNEGVMHACGHDVHTSCLLGAVKILNELKEEFEGTIKVIFQPAEEKLPGGASLMLKEGALEDPRPSKIIGQHVYPQLPAGKVGFGAGPYMASSDELHVTVKGKGGHAALPESNKDPVPVAAKIILDLKNEFDPAKKPDTPFVLSFGKIVADGATNIVPGEVKIEGTFRTFDEDFRLKAHKQMVEMAENIAKAMGCTCDFQVKVGYPVLVNDEAITANCKQLAQEYLGEDNVVDLDKRMTSEDFAWYTQQFPGCFYRLGVANHAEGISSGLHTPTFNVDEKCLETGAGLMAWLTVNQLQ